MDTFFLLHVFLEVQFIKVVCTTVSVVKCGFLLSAGLILTDGIAESIFRYAPQRAP